jgi:hypothetical protein
MSRARSIDYDAASEALDDHISEMLAFAAEMRCKYHASKHAHEWTSSAAPSELRRWNAMQRRREKLEETALQAWKARR